MSFFTRWAQALRGRPKKPSTFTTTIRGRRVVLANQVEHEGVALAMAKAERVVRQVMRARPRREDAGPQGKHHPRRPDEQHVGVLQVSDGFGVDRVIQDVMVEVSAAVMGQVVARVGRPLRDCDVANAALKPGMVSHAPKVNPTSSASVAPKMTGGRMTYRTSRSA